MEHISRRAFVTAAGSVVGACALSGGLSTLLAGCASDPVEKPPVYVSPYDFSGLSFDERGRARYTENGRDCSLTGIDVSDHQGTIDWNAVAGDGIDFALIRIGNRGTTEGGLYADANLAENLAGARAAGLAVGAYFFSQAVNDDEARGEAEFALERLDGTPLDFPLTFDQEPVTIADARANDVSRAQLTSNARIFCDTVSAAGYKTMIYGNAGDIARLDVERLSDTPLWFAEYDAQTPGGRFDFVMWQYSSSGSVAGIDTRVDMNLYFTDDCAERPWKGRV